MGEPGGGTWVAICDVLRRRLGLRLALACLVSLYAAAIYAPLVANDRPYLVEAVDYRAYDGARRELVTVASSLATLAEQGRSGFAAALPAEARVRDYGAALGAERDALLARCATMERYLASGADTLLLRLEQAAERTVAAASSGRQRSAVEAASETLTLARAVGEHLRPRRPDVRDPTAVPLSPVRSYPLLAALSPLEVLLMTVWAFVLTAPLWRPRRAPGWKLLGVLALAGAVTVAWPRWFGAPGPALAVSAKAGLSTGDVVATRVVFPPIAMGFAETNLSESLRPPTWQASARVGPDGRTPGGEPAAVPVHVRFGELPRNHPLRHPLGTDALGRDLLVRMIWGGRISLAVGLASAALLVSIGVLVGAAAGYFGGWCDTVLSRCIEVVQCFPAFFLIVSAVALIPARTLHPLFSVVLVIGLVGWTGVARLVRAEFLRERELEYVLAARALGMRAARIMFLHVLPNVIGPVLVAGTFAVASGILMESGVSFLGFGVQDPIPSWGALMNESQSLDHWWLTAFPGLAIFAAVLATHLLGEGLREVLDPRLAAVLARGRDHRG